MAERTLTQQRFDSLVQDHVGPLLKAAGFKKQALNFRRRWGAEREGGWHVINIQKSQWGDRNSISFTINIGVACDLYTRYEGKDPSKAPTESECCWRMRIGQLMKDRGDRWWELNDSRRFEHPAPEVVWAVSDLALPRLAQLSTLEGIMASLDKVKPGKYAEGWDWNSVAKAVMLRGQPRVQARVIAELRKAYSDSPENVNWIEAKIKRLRAKW
jgi:hypothetical protein